MSALVESDISPLLELLNLKGDSTGPVGSVVGHVTAEPSLIGPLCRTLAEQVNPPLVS